MFIVPLIAGVAGVIDGFATGVYVNKKWGSKAAVVAAVESVATRAITIPSGGVKTIAAEVATEAEVVVNKVAEVGTEVGGAVQSVSDLHSKLTGLLAVAQASAPK
jgi:hypothetical protein